MFGIACIGKCLLIIVNLVFLLTGVIILIVGNYIDNNNDVFKTEAENMQIELDDVQDMLEMKSNKSIDISLHEFIVPMGNFLLVFGSLILILALMGIFGAFCNIKKVLIAYLVLVVLLFLFQFIMFICINNGTFCMFDGSVRASFVESLQSYDGFPGTKLTSITWNGLMIAGKCCGIDDYHDFKGLPNWPPEWATKDGIELAAPLMCCKQIDNMEDGMECAKNPSTSNSNYKMGCYDALFDMFFKNSAFEWLSIFLLLPQAAVIVIAGYVVYTMGDDLDSEVKNPLQRT